MCNGVYSPKIKEKYIPVLYLLAQDRNISMTKLVNEMIESEINLLTERRRNGKGGTNDQRLTNPAGGS